MSQPKQIIGYDQDYPGSYRWPIYEVLCPECNTWPGRQSTAKSAKQSTMLNTISVSTVVTGYFQSSKGVTTMSTTKKPAKAKIHIRWMIRRDMPETLQIEQTSFEWAWTEEDFLRCLRQRNCIGMVAEHGEKVVGYMIYELHKSKLHILNFAVSVAYRRRAVGAQLVQKLISKLSSHRRTRIRLEVRETNLAAQLFWRSQEFKAIQVLRSHYEDSSEDAFLMEFKIGEGDE